MRNFVRNGALYLREGTETVLLQPWGKGIRVRAVPGGELPEGPDWALENPSAPDAVLREGDAPCVENGSLRCVPEGTRLRFYDGEKLLLEEKLYSWSPRDSARVYRPHPGAEGFEAKVRFEARKGEILHGMGQYRDIPYDLKGCLLETAHRNSQISVPFLLSDRGYGLLWNNPCSGRVVFGENLTEYVAGSTRCVDYWVCCGSPAEIQAAYAAVTGLPSRLPDDFLGLWQCKLRYRTQQEVLDVAREYVRRGLPLKGIVIDFFHWPQQGDWRFDPEFWPDPKAMVEELESYGVKCMVSVWPTVDHRSENYAAFRDGGWLIQTDRGMDVVYDFPDPQRIYDATNPEARAFAWSLLKKNYLSDGIGYFWLDQAEPELGTWDRDNVRFYAGPQQMVGNLYPREHCRMVYEGMRAEGKTDVCSLVRCAWVGSPRYGALVWSGDIESSFREMRVQLGNALNMAAAGIPYWITDTGGFYGGDVRDEEMRELEVRWFQWACFQPVTRLHGDRQPDPEPIVTGTREGGGFMRSGASNELWSYGEEAYEIMKKYLLLRESMRSYVRAVADEAEKTGMPMMRPLYYVWPEDRTCWELADEYLFGEKYLVCPVAEYRARERRVYFPAGSWVRLGGGERVDSAGEWRTVPAPLEDMPVYERKA